MAELPRIALMRAGRDKGEAAEERVGPGMRCLGRGWRQVEVGGDGAVRHDEWGWIGVAACLLRKWRGTVLYVLMYEVRRDRSKYVRAGW